MLISAKYTRLASIFYIRLWLRAFEIIGIHERYSNLQKTVNTAYKLLPSHSLDYFDVKYRGAQFNPQVVPQDEIHLCAAGGGDISQVNNVPPPKPGGQPLGHPVFGTPGRYR